jgi:hypothetical protein
VPVDEADLELVPVVEAVERVGVPELNVTVELPATVPLLNVSVSVTVEPSSAVLVVVELGPVVIVMVPEEVVVPAEVVVIAAVALNAEQSCAPTVWASRRSESAQDLRRHGAALSPMAFCVGPHWQAWSERSQPAAAMAEERHAV